jgi:replicative DNA helicase
MNAAVDRMGAPYGPGKVEQLRMPPQSVEAEQAVLGGLMLAPEALAKVGDWLDDADFYRRDHQLIYRAICELAEARKPYDAVTLAEWFEGQGKVEEVRGGAYLVELASTTPSAANIVAYAEIVKEKSLLRSGIDAGTKLVNECFSPEGKGSREIFSDAAHAITSLRGDPRGGGLVSAAAGLNDWFDDLQRRYEQGNRITGLPYPWHAVNEVTHGLQPGELTIIAARPSMGKSVMGLNLALFAAMREVNVGFFSLEMTTRQINRRSIASLSDVPHDWLLAPDSENDTYWPRVTDAIRKIKAASLLVDETAGLNVSQFMARARRAHMQKPLGLIVLDHLHDMDFAGKRDMRHEVGEAVAAGKKLAKEFNCPAVLLAQLNRGVETRQNRRPVMADLRESGEIEQKADVIWFLYRHDYYARLENPSFEPTHAVELILGKGRDLQVGAPVVLREAFNVMRLEDWDFDRHGPIPTHSADAKQKAIAQW